MFSYRKTIFLKETDATGVIYFTSLFEYALEAFEAMLKENNIFLTDFFAKGYLMPIVHTEADFKAPLKVGDEILVELSLERIGNKSFSLKSIVKNLPDLKETGTVQIVHSFMKRGDKEASEIPEEIRALLQKVSL